MCHLYAAAGRPLIQDLNDMVSVAGTKRHAQLTYPGLISRFFKGIDHGEHRKIVQITPVLLHRCIFGCGPGNHFEGLPAHDPAADLHDPFIGGKGILGRGILRQPDQDMLCMDIIFGPFIGFSQHLLPGLLIGQVWFGQLFPVTFEFLDEPGGGIHAQGFCLLHLQLEINEEIQIFFRGLPVQRGCIVVLAVDPFEFLQRDGLVPDLQQDPFVLPIQPRSQQSGKNDEDYTHFHRLQCVFNKNEGCTYILSAVIGGFPGNGYIVRMAFMISGSLGYLGSFNPFMAATMQGIFISITCRAPPSISLSTTTLSSCRPKAMTLDATGISSR